MPPTSYWRKTSRVVTSIITVVAFLLLTAPGQTLAAPVRLHPSQYPCFSDDLQLRQLADALERSLQFLQSVPAATTYAVGGERVSAQRLINTARSFQELIRSASSFDQLNRQVREAYIVFWMNGDLAQQARRTIITGYYQPVFAGSLQRKPPYLYPLYAVPESLVVAGSGTAKKTLGRRAAGQIVPFWTRKEIERDRVLQGGELVWLRDIFDVYVLHVQGSGILRLPDGTVRGVHYAQNNGRAYRSIGKYLVDTGRMALADVTMDSIRQYLAAHPEERDLILQQNDSFIFFDWSDPDTAVGSLGQKLTVGRSLAADPQWYPPGALAYLESRKPIIGKGQAVQWEPLRRFATVQDSGSGITGTNRVDIFWGSGEQAGMEAGQMKEEGNLYLLLLNEENGPKP